MINIEEKTPEKLSGISSLFISFKYNPKVIEAIKSLAKYVYNEDTHVWEVPCIYLAELLDNLTFVDDINLKLIRTGINITCSHPVNEYPEWIIQAVIKLYEE